MKAIFQILFLFILSFPPVGPVSALKTADAPEFRNYEVINGFPQSLSFKIEICNLPENHLVYLNYTIGPSSWSSSSNTIPSHALTEDGCRRFRTSVFTRDEPPMLDVQYYWWVKVRGAQVRSPLQEFVYEDPDYEWQALENDDVTVYWHDRPHEFGMKIFDIAVRSIEKQGEFYGTQLENPALIVIANTDDEFMAWQVKPDPNTGGLALPWYGMTIQLVEDDSEAWLNDVLPHEISHLYFSQVTKYSDVWPPLWLDEGVAVYSEFSDHHFEYDLVHAAVLQNRLISLSQLRDDFGTDDQEVDLAYAESYYAVVYMLEVHGEEKVALLLQEYNNGRNHDEVFQAAFNRSITQFEEDWETWVKSRFKAETIAPATPRPQAEIPNSDPGRANFTIFVALCCSSLIVGAIGLAGGLLLWKTTARKAVS